MTKGHIYNRRLSKSN